MEIATKENIEDFLKGYMSCALWTEEKEGETISKDQCNEMRSDCNDFLKENENLIDQGEPINKWQWSIYNQAGHDFWLTRNGHGTGFWDRPEVWGKSQAEILTKNSKYWGEYYLDI